MMQNPALKMWSSARSDAADPASADIGSAPASSACATHGVGISSKELGWQTIEFERHDCEPCTRGLNCENRQHLIFVSLSGGRIARESDGQRVEYQLKPGLVTLVPAGTQVKWTWFTRVSFSVLRLSPRLLDAVAWSVFGLTPRDYHLILTERERDTPIANIAGVLARETMRAERGSRLYADSLANMLAVHLLRHYAKRSDGGSIGDHSSRQKVATAMPADTAEQVATQPRAVSDALTFMHANYARGLTLADIANAVHLSPFHLTRVFKQCLGVSPHQYLIQVRLNNARSLLAAGSRERSLSEVAAAVGFADQSHFTRHFKRATGTTPGQYRA